jgi:hypothetical protein
LTRDVGKERGDVQRSKNIKKRAIRIDDFQAQIIKFIGCFLSNDFQSGSYGDFDQL